MSAFGLGGIFALNLCAKRLQAAWGLARAAKFDKVRGCFLQ